MNTLPSEILAYIFELVQDLVGWPDFSIFADWAHVTWVCRHWRAVAISSTKLWTTIARMREGGTISPWLSASLNRAACTPISVSLSLTVTQPVCHNVLRLVLPHSSSFRTLFLVLSSHSGKDAFSFAWTALAPHVPHMTNLETLGLQMTTPSVQSAAVPVFQRHSFPRLQALSLNGFYFPWTSSMYTALRKLTLMRPKAVLPVATFLQIVRASPDLEELRLIMDDAFTPRDVILQDSRTAELAPVVLPKLQTLLLTGRYAYTKPMWERICTRPSQSCIEVHATFVIQRGETEDPISLLAPIYSTMKAALWYCTHVELVAYARSGIHLYFEDRSTWMYNRISVTGDIPQNPNLEPATWKAVLSPFASSPIRSFRVSYDRLHHISTAMWDESLAWFPRLEDLDFGPNDPYRTGDARVLEMFADVFAVLMGLTASDGRPPAPCLRKLIIFHMILDGPTTDAVVHLLEVRAEKGVPLREVVFKGAVCADGADVAAVKTRLEKLVKVTVM